MVVLPEPVGPVTDDDAVGLGHHGAEGPQVVLAHAEFLEVETDLGTVQHTKHDALAEHRRQHAHAQVDRVAGDDQLDAAVLRHASLGDVEIGHDLDSGADGVGDVPRRRHHLVQHAVDAVAHLELVLEGLEVDVAGLVLDRLQQHKVEQLLDRVGVGDLAEFVEVDTVAAAFELRQPFVPLDLLEDFCNGRTFLFGIVSLQGAVRAGRWGR